MRKALAMPISEARRVNEEGDLECEVAGVGVDAEDLVLDLFGLVGQQFLELCVAHDLGVVFEDFGDALLVGRGEDAARFGHVGEGDARASRA